MALVWASEPDECSRKKKKNKDCILTHFFKSDRYIQLINYEKLKI